MAVKFDMLGIVTADMDRSRLFYALLGWDFPSPSDGGPYTEITLDSGLRISLNHMEMVRGMEPDWTPATGHRMGIAFLCDTPADVDALYALIVEAGFEGHRAPWDAFWGQRYAQVLDPDGNIVDLFCPLG